MPGTCQHTYDDLARVSQVNCVNGNWGQNFTYDAFGNIKKSQFGVRDVPERNLPADL
jgi:hypothetical protein